MDTCPSNERKGVLFSKVDRKWPWLRRWDHRNSLWRINNIWSVNPCACFFSKCAFELIIIYWWGILWTVVVIGIRPFMIILHNFKWSKSKVRKALFFCIVWKGEIYATENKVQKQHGCRFSPGHDTGFCALQCICDAGLKKKRHWKQIHTAVNGKCPRSIRNTRRSPLRNNGCIIRCSLLH